MSLLKNELSNYPVIFVKKDLRHWTSWKNWLVYGSLLEKRSITIRPLWRLFHVQCGLTCTPWTPMCVNSKWEVPIWTKKEWCSHRPNSVSMLTRGAPFWITLWKLEGSMKKTEFYPLVIWVISVWPGSKSYSQDISSSTCICTICHQVSELEQGRL